MVAGAVGEAGARRAIFRRSARGFTGRLKIGARGRSEHRDPSGYFAPLGTGAAVALMHAAAITGASSYEISDSVPWQR